MAAAADAAVVISSDDSIARLAASLAAGLLVGLQRQFAKQHEHPDLFAGARSFALIAMTGAACSLLAIRFDDVLPLVAGFVAVAVVVAIGYLGGVRRGSVGITTEMSALATFTAGALAGDGQFVVAGALAVATTALLAAKPYTSAFVAHLDRRDVEATVQFAVLVALVLPILPREPIGPSPFDAASPFSIGLMVVFILGLSFLGYVLIGVIGPRRGIGLTGMLGGLVSSTAVTLTMSERSRANPGVVRPLAMAVMLAWTIMFGRLLVIVGVVNPDLLVEVALPIAAGGVACLAWVGRIALRDESAEVDADADRLANPFSIGPAIRFGLLYGVVLIGSKALSTWLGDTGVYLGAVVSGVADVDAITVSLAKLSATGERIPAATAADAIVLAAAVNTVVKGVLVWISGSPALRRLVAPAVVVSAAASVGLAFSV